MSKIQWTDDTWNPTTGCSWESPGCDNCYAFTLSKRLAAMGQEKYQGIAGKGHFNGKLLTHDDELEKPLHWRKPRMVFVNSMSDLFHERVPFEFIDRVFAVMATCPQHIFQILTKRPQRMAEYLAREDCCDLISAQADGINFELCWPWPLTNVWLGTSCEDQRRADERIPHLLRCPAAVPFLSCEPLLGPIDLTRIVLQKCERPVPDVSIDALKGWYGGASVDRSRIGWVITGGESGPGARVCQTQWIRGIVRQCQAANVPVFVKQLGSKPGTDHRELDCEQKQAGGRLFLNDKKGGNPDEWPEDLRVREFPLDCIVSMKNQGANLRPSK